MENQPVGDPPSKTFTWKIDNFSSLNEEGHYSEIFVVGEYKWRVLIFPRGNKSRGNNCDSLSVYLDVADSTTAPYGWRRNAYFCLAVVDQVDNNHSVKKETKHWFDARVSDFGFTSFMPLDVLQDPARGYLVNDTCVIEVFVVCGDNTDYHWERLVNEKKEKQRNKEKEEANLEIKGSEELLKIKKEFNCKISQAEGRVCSLIAERNDSNRRAEAIQVEYNDLKLSSEKKLALNAKLLEERREYHCQLEEKLVVVLNEANISQAIITDLTQEKDDLREMLNMRSNNIKNLEHELKITQETLRMSQNKACDLEKHMNLSKNMVTVLEDEVSRVRVEFSEARKFLQRSLDEAKQSGEACKVLSWELATANELLQKNKDDWQIVSHELETMVQNHGSLQKEWVDAEGAVREKNTAVSLNRNLQGVEKQIVKVKEAFKFLEINLEEAIKSFGMVSQNAFIHQQRANFEISNLEDEEDVFCKSLEEQKNVSREARENVEDGDSLITRLGKERESVENRAKKLEGKMASEKSFESLSILGVAPDNDTGEQIPGDIYFDLVEHDTVWRFCIQKQMSYNLPKIREEEIHVYHFTRGMVQNQMQIHKFGQPFLLAIHEGETLAELKVRIHKKLKVPDKNFQKWKFAFLSRGSLEYLQDCDVVLSCFQGWSTFKQSIEPSVISGKPGLPESAPVIIEDPDFIFTDLDLIISGASHAASTCTDTSSNDIHMAPFSKKEIAEAKTLFKNCLALNFKHLVHPHRCGKFLEAIDVLSLSSEFSTEQISILEKFRSDFTSLSAVFLASERELDEYCHMTVSKTSLAETLKQTASEYKSLKSQEESVCEDIKALQQQLNLKEKEREEILFMKQNLARETQTEKSALASYNIEAPSWEKRRRNAEETFLNVLSSWDTFRKSLI